MHLAEIVRFFYFKELRNKVYVLSGDSTFFIFKGGM